MKKKRERQRKLAEFWKNLHWSIKLGIGIFLLRLAVAFTVLTEGTGAAAVSVLIQVAIGVGVGIGMYAISSLLTNTFSWSGLANAALDAFLVSSAIAFVTSGISYVKHLCRSKPVSTAELASIKDDCVNVANNPPKKITGYTQHGLEQAMFRNGHGVSPKGILDAVRNPVDIIYDVQRDTYKFIGTKSITVLNRSGKIVTTWAKSSFYWRY